MKKLQVLAGLFVGIVAVSYANLPTGRKDEAISHGDREGPQQVKPSDSTKEPDLSTRDDPKLVKAVEEALAALSKQSPVVQEDSLRVWKNFKSTSKPVNYTYRFWGRQLILWLKEHKQMVFKTETDVGNVFKVLYHKGLISKNAVIVLMVDAWGHLVYLEGSPDWEKRDENRPGNSGEVPNAVNQRKSNEPV